MREGRLGPRVSAQRVTVLGLDVRRRGRGRAQLLLHVHHFTAPRQEGVAQQLAKQGLLRQVIQEISEVLHGSETEVQKSCTDAHTERTQKKMRGDKR